MSIVVVGSLNHDITARVPRIPRPGETVLGSGHFAGPGGKGANQAVGAARLGGDVAMVGRVGADSSGRFLRRRLIRDGIDDTHVLADTEVGSGTALITVDDSAENAIVVSPGANARVNPEDIEMAAATIAAASIVLLQLEIPMDAVVAAAETATGTVILNPAPASLLPGALLERVDVLVPNQIELAMLTDDELSVEAAARKLADGRDVVVTLGASGALVAERTGEVTIVDAPQVEAIDTVGAGDCFCGALATAIDDGWSLVEATHLAVIAASLAVTKRGAQDSMPTRTEVEIHLAR